ncbi:unnamed protein product [Symbiodinium sp. CCMP2592]|nr:unnamed protein product [Symbiodinium sp. CCMP2592]
MLQVTASPDRWTAKILAYPCFDAAFVSALLGTQLANLQVVLAMEVETPGMFAQKVYEWTSKLAPEAHEAFAARPQMLEQFYIFAKAAETLFEESLGYQMGFSRCEKIPRQRSSRSIAEFQRDMAIRALAENAEKQKWAKRLKAIADRAGDHAKPKAPDHGLLTALSGGESSPPVAGFHFRGSIDNVESYSPIREVRIVGPSVGSAVLPHYQRSDPKVCHRARRHGVRTNGAAIPSDGVALGLIQDKYRSPFYRFVVPDVAFSRATWFKVGLELFELEFPLVERDFWIPDLETKEKWRETPPDYARSLQSSLPALMIKDLVAEISKDFTPQCALADDVIDDSDDREATLTEFFIKEIACKRAITPEFVHIGSVLPEVLANHTAELEKFKQAERVPHDPYVVRDLGPWALEIFAGTARLTSHWRSAGLLVLPPIDVTISGQVYESVDLLDDKVFQRVLLLCRVGAIAFLHLGLPCSTFSRARSRPGGPPPLRSLAQPLGLLSVDHGFRDQLDRANLLMQRSIDLLEATIVAGGDASLENPLTSLLWQVPDIQQLKVRFHLYNLDLDQCEFGKHKHLPLKGKVRQANGSWVFATKPAQEYPLPLCAALAQMVEQVVHACLPQFQASFELVAPKQDRKRKLGQAVNWKGHRQEQAARLAASSGYQLKRGAAKPLLDVECEPGVAIRWALGIPHPCTVQPDVPLELITNIDRIAARPLWLVDYRIKQLDYWHARAVALLADTDRELRAIPDPALRRLLRGAPDYADLQLGHCTHVKLYDELLAAARCQDLSLLQGIRQGFPIVGQIQRSGRWPPYEKKQSPVTIEAESRAWEFRSKIFKRCQAVPVSDNLRSLWQATMEDVMEGSTVGPFQDESSVTEFLGCSDWIPTQRFEVVQKNKVRGCDSATSNLVNKTAVITEKLQLPNTDLNVSVVRELRTRVGDRPLRGWVLDERKAYRQLPIAPRHRKFSVICLKDPSDDRPKFFVMIGHSFGLVSAVYNYNRRSAALNDVFVKLFYMVAFNFYDDKYGFETDLTASSAKLVAEKIHFFLGASFDQKKLQLSESPVILGVTFNLDEFLLEIKEDHSSDRMELNEALRRSLIYWKFLINSGGWLADSSLLMAIRSRVKWSGPGSCTDCSFERCDC